METVATPMMAQPQQGAFSCVPVQYYPQVNTPGGYPQYYVPVQQQMIPPTPVEQQHEQPDM